MAESTALQEMRKAAEYQRELASAIEAKPAAKRPAAASLARLLEPPLLSLAEEKRAEPVPEGEKEARPEEAAAAVEVDEVEVEKFDLRRRWNGALRCAGSALTLRFPCEFREAATSCIRCCEQRGEEQRIIEGREREREK